MAVIAISAYLLGAVFIVFWLYLNTKITFYLVPKKHNIFRIIVWLILGWILIIVFYVAFIVIAMLIGYIAQIFFDFKL